MSHYINMFFSTEFTCIPRIAEKYLGKYYSNAVGNALTWVFVMWLILHYIFDAYLNVLLKQMHYKLYVRTRLLNALWYCGFYGTGLLYCLGTVVRNNTSVIDYRKNLVLDGGAIPLHLLMGLGLIGAFFFQSFVWTANREGFDKNCLTFLTLSFLPLTTYYSRRTELLISLLALISLIHFIYNTLRCLTCTMGKGQVYLKWIFIASMSLFVLIHVIIVPIFFIVPLIYNLRFGLNIPVIILSINLVLWWICEALSNPLYKYIEHWIKHSDVKDPRICPSNLLECCLFPIRDDFSFNMCLVRWEIKQRKEKSIRRRKPKDRNVFVQTLKCMVAIRRRLKGRPKTDPSESDSDNEEDKEESESSEEEETSDEEEDDPEKLEYQEETARALQEDQQSNSTTSTEKSLEQSLDNSTDSTREPSVDTTLATQEDTERVEDKKND